MTRAEAWRRFGAPDDQLGSANEPRSAREEGVCWNEKWIYLAPGGERAERVLLWNRYALAAVFRVDEAGAWHREEAA